MPPTITDDKTAPALSLHGEPAKFALGYHEVAHDTWAWLQPNGALGESNSGLIVSGEHALVVDSLWDLKLTQRMLDEARKIVDVAPEALVNTHSDGDHVWGNQLFSGARIISGSTAKDLMTLDMPKDLRAMRTGGKALAAIGALPVPFIGTVDVGDLPRLPLREMGREFAPFDWREIELTLPTETFDGELAVRIGDREVQLIEIGPAHTGGDTVVWVPDVNVCFAADILFIDGTPITWAGPVKSWIAAIDRGSALGAARDVPAHGPICGQKEVDLVREYFEWVQSEGVTQLARGVKPVKAARNLLLSNEFEQLPWARWDDPARLVVTLCSEQHRRDGATGQLLGVGRSRAIASMQATKTAIARKRKRG